LTTIRKNEASASTRKWAPSHGNPIGRVKPAAFAVSPSSQRSDPVSAIADTANVAL
jgi:hypothetical protein